MLRVKLGKFRRFAITYRFVAPSNPASASQLFLAVKITYH